MFRVSVLLVASVAIVACGGAAPVAKDAPDAGVPDAGTFEEPDAGVLPPITGEDFAAAIHSLLCAESACTLGMPPDRAQTACFVPDDPDLAPAVDSGRLVVDPALGRQCLEAIAGLDPAECWGQGARRVISNGARRLCQSAVRGTVPRGKACFTTPECAEGWCDQSAVCPGVCRPHLADGAKCEAQEECTPPSYCAVNGTCVRGRDVGASCDAGRPCAPPGFCFDGVCRTDALETGQSCAASYQCSADAYCYKTNLANALGACRARVPTGGECTWSGAWESIESVQCAVREVCAGLLFDSQGNVARAGHCRAPSNLGEPCFPDGSVVYGLSGCYLGLLCDVRSKTCILGPKAGEACNGGACATGFICNTHDACVRMPGAGEPCIRGWCEGGNYCDGTTCHALLPRGQRCPLGRECEGTCNASHVCVGSDDCRP